jgi:uncharacterized membrane protein YphA (DoxX/SURF4 family)
MKGNVIKPLLRSLPAALLILLFVYTVTSKLSDIPEFRHEMRNQNFPREMADALVYLVPGAEILAVVLLLSSRWYREGLLLSTALLFAFTGYISLVLAGYWKEVPCSCGGVLRNLSWGAHLFFNLFFLLIGIFGILQESREPPAPPPSAPQSGLFPD